MDINMRAAHQFNHWVSSFVVLNDTYRRVVLVDAKQVFYRDFQDVSEDRADHSTVTKYDDAVMRMHGNNFIKHRDHPVPELEKGFSPFNVKLLYIIESFLELVWVLAIDFSNAQSFPVTEGQFA